MYTIIGGDGKEYGPVSAEQVRQWIATGRANGQTLAKAVDTTDWKPLVDFLEFDQARPLTAALTPAGPAPFDPLECFNRSWQLLRANFWSFVGVCLLPVIVSVGVTVALSQSPLAPVPNPGHPFAIFTGAYLYFRIVLTLLIFQPLTEGSIYFILKRARGEAAGFSDLFAGFTRSYVSLVLAALIGMAAIGLGFLCLILPGIYLGVAYSFSRLAVIDRRCGSWAALELSRRAITPHWWSFFLLLILGGVISMVGVVALFVGVFIAIPLFYGALVYAYLDLTPPTIASAP